MKIERECNEKLSDNLQYIVDRQNGEKWREKNASENKLFSLTFVKLAKFACVGLNLKEKCYKYLLKFSFNKMFFLIVFLVIRTCFCDALSGDI